MSKETETKGAAEGESPAPSKKGKGTPSVVRATRFGFYRSQRIRQGVTFTLLDDKDFAKHWMERVDASTPDDIAKRFSPRKTKLTAEGAGPNDEVI